MTSAPASAIRVRRWRSTCLVPRDHPAPERVRERIDASVRNDLPAVFAARFTTALDARNPEIVLVRRLELDFAVDAAWDAGALAAACAAQLGMRLARALAGGDSTNVMRFKGPAEYLARWLVDLADGDAASRWYYARFAGLRLLPCAVALRTSLLEDVELGRAAMRGLAPGERARVLTALGRSECARVLDAMAAVPDAGDAAQAFGAFASLSATDANATALDAAALALDWLAQTPVPLTRAAVHAARTLARLRVGVQCGGFATAQLRRASAGDAAAIAALAREDLTLWQDLRECPRDVIAPMLAAAATSGGVDSGGAEYTRFGAPFLLLDDVFALPLEEAAQDWPPLDGTPALSLLRFLVLCRCCGAERAAAVFHDPLWRSLFALAPAIDAAAAAHWLEALGPRRRRGLHHALSRRDTLAPPDRAYLGSDQTLAPSAWQRVLARAAAQVLRAFLARLPGFAASPFDYAWRNLLAVSAVVQTQKDRIVVRLSRAPLGLMLNLTGRSRGTRNWLALDARPFVLFDAD